MRSLILSTLALICLSTTNAFANAPACYILDDVNLLGLTPAQQYAMKLYTRLSGAPPSVSDPRFTRVVDLLTAGDEMAAVNTIMDTPNFLKVRVRNFSIPFVDKVHQASDTLTDLQALIIGVVRDGLDARLLLTGNLRYSGYASLGLPPVSRENNDHYVQFESRDLDFDRDLERVDKQWEDVDTVAGALTTRAWAAAYYNAGTNRLGVKYSLENFLCVPIERWKIRGLPDYYVRRDIERSPAGNPAEYQNNCRNCHAAMDAIGGAFAKLDFVEGKFTYQVDGVRPKMNNNPEKYPAGFVTTDDSWINLLGQHPTVDFGWRGAMSGSGIQAYAQTLANSTAFSACMVQKVFSEVCGKSMFENAPELIRPMSEDFETNGYNLKYLFGKVALQDACLSHGTEAK